MKWTKQKILLGLAVVVLLFAASVLISGFNPTWSNQNYEFQVTLTGIFFIIIALVLLIISFIVKK